MSSMSRLEDLESRVQALEATCLGLVGAAVMASVATLVRRRGVASFNTVSARRIVLARPGPSSSLSAPDVALAELTVRQGRPELRIHGGAVVLTGGGQARPTLVTIEAGFRQVRPTAADGPLGPGQAWALDRHGLDAALSPYRDRPAVALYGPDERLDSVWGVGGVVDRLGALEAPGTTEASAKDAAGGAAAKREGGGGGGGGGGGKLRGVRPVVYPGEKG
jgi:hypothetical protein